MRYSGAGTRDELPKTFAWEAMREPAPDQVAFVFAALQQAQFMKYLRFSPWGLLLGIRGGGVPSGSSNPDLISNQ